MSRRSVSEIVQSFSRFKVIVLGDAMLDTYTEGSANRICPEAPVPVVQMRERREAPGGAANTALNLRALGAHVRLLSVAGDDAEGDSLSALLDAKGVPPEAIFREPGRRTLAKHRICADGQILLRLDQGDTEPVSAETEAALVETLMTEAETADAIVVSDYGHGVMTPRLIGALGRVSERARRLLVVDAKELRLYRAACPAAVKPNYEQALALLGRPQWAGDRADAISAAAERILDITGARLAAVTLDSEGALFLQRGREPYRTYAQAAPHRRTAGAGDTFVAVMTLALATGADTPMVGELASAGAAIVIGKEETATCSVAELLAGLGGKEKSVEDLAVLRIGLDYERQQGRRIVFTNGCFDILHAGHTAYLNRAKSLGDVLVVGVNSDESVRALKGETRPINTLDDRIRVLAAMSCIDYIVSFDEETPIGLIEEIRPDVFVKGGDYTREMLPEAPVVESLGGEVQILPYVEDRSTTGIIQRVREREALVGGPL